MKEKTAKIRFTKDELRLIKFLISNRNDDNSAKMYQEFINTLGETHVGIKVTDALSEIDK